ncbi:MAG: CRP/FNR family cyclic AMP-dependent transcriptional regulator [Cellvibrionaceae bacterium]|jgi:CRP/FNR family cyclic AMP-dependent transcriptional regulator
MNSDAEVSKRFLTSVPFFTNLTPAEVDELARLLIPRRFQAGSTVFHLGDPGGLLYIILSGKIKISHSNPEGQEALLAIMGQGDFFGELALLDESPRSATAEAIAPTETLTLHRDDFMRFIDDHPAFARHVLTSLARRVRHMNSQISDIFFLDLPGRLARTLLKLSEQHGRETANGVQIEISLTQTDLAEMTGATRVSVNKALGRFRRQGWVGVKGRKFTIIDAASLEQLIELAGG